MTVREYVLMIWDGMGFFSCDETKLRRLKGAKVGFSTKFKSYKWIFTNILLVMLLVFVLNS